MKTLKTMRTVACRSSFVLAVALVTWLGGQVQAQQLPTGKGAGAAKLLELNRSKAPSNDKPDTTIPTPCPKCRSEWASRTDYTARGAVKPKVWVEKHLCEGCDTTISAVGHGKAKHEVVTHKCTSCGATDASCCATTKGASPTKAVGKS